MGAGVFGSWCAHFLRQTGARVLLAEQYAPGHSRSSSGGESRIIRMGYGTDEIYTRMSLRSLDLWRRLFARAGEDLFVPTGVLWLARSGDGYAARTEETLRRVGVAIEHLEPVELRTRYPQINFDGIDWALWEPGSGVLLARRAVAAAVKQCVTAGVEFRTLEIAPFGGAGKFRGGLRTAAGEKISAGAFVFCCGPWLPELFPELLAERMFITRQEVFFFGTPAGNSGYQPQGFPTWLEMSAGMYGMPDIEGRGAKVALDLHGAPFDPDTGERTPSPQAYSAARNYLARRFPQLGDAPLVEARVCQYENTSNGDFLIDRHPDYNVWLVGGGSGHGFKHGPAVGEYVADLLHGHRAPEPRFSLASKASRQSRAVY